nr:MAG TPA: hypothetical protein [Caudoviricetes sp.]
MQWMSTIDDNFSHVILFQNLLKRSLHSIIP